MKSFFRSGYNERAKHFKERLEEFRSEIEGLKREERLTEQDRQHMINLQRGLDKQGTLRMVRKSGYWVVLLRD